MRIAARLAFCLLPLLAAVACGGAGQGGSTASLSAVTPSSDLLSVALDGADASAMPTAALGTGSAAVVQADAAADAAGVVIPTDVPCHPHLFLRTEAVSRRLNRHLYKFLGRIDALVIRHPAVDTTGQVVWERVTASGLDEKFTVALVSDQTYSWKLELRQGATGDFTTVFSGQVDRAGATGPHQGTGTLTLDLTALKSVVPAEPAEGTIAVAFDVNPTSRLITLDAKDVSWDVGDDPADLAPVAPRNAHYVFFREPGKGGSLKAADQMIFACPLNPELKRADVELVHRWYVTGGAVHGRSDAQMLNGQLTAAQRVAGVTCHERPVGGPLAEGFWQMKLEEGGAVVVAGSHQSGTGDPCDPVFGAVPAIDSTTGDFDFTAIDFTDGKPYPFPGM